LFQVGLLTVIGLTGKKQKREKTLSRKLQTRKETLPLAAFLHHSINNQHYQKRKHVQPDCLEARTGS
jgi:hypothetical protein